MSNFSSPTLAELQARLNGDEPVLRSDNANTEFIGGDDSLSIPIASSISSESERFKALCESQEPEVVAPLIAPIIADASIHQLALDIKNPLELLLLVDDDIKSGYVTLAPWQIQYLIDFAEGGASCEKALHQLLIAANGSGKDRYIIAPCVVWLMMRYKKARAIATSGSGNQLDTQTGKYIYMLCKAVNRVFNELFGKSGEIWKINYRYCECLLTESTVDLFATDEPLKAEGFHPYVAGGKMLIAVSEDKGVPDDINIALNRCTGYTHRMHVSTPGAEMGHFYDYSRTAIERHQIKSVHDLSDTDWVKYHITAYDCPYIPRSHIERMKQTLPGGEKGVAFRSSVLAEFGSVEAMVVIPSHLVWKATKGSVYGHKAKTYNDAGVDLADGGDETVICIRNGNKLTHVVPFKFDNSEDTITFLDEQFKSFGLNNQSSRINADCGGAGKPVLDRLKRMGWSNIFYIDNRNTPHEPRVYKNRAAELWFRFRKLLELNEVWLISDDKLKHQLATRFYRINEGDGTHQLESKLKARAKGRPSPDRADACILAFWDYEQLTKESAPEHLPFKPTIEPKPNPVFTQREFVKRDERPRYTKTPHAGQDFSYIKAQIREYNSLQRAIESN